MLITLNQWKTLYQLLRAIFFFRRWGGRQPRQWRPLAEIIGWFSLFNFLASKKHALVDVNIKGESIRVRKGTPDLTVAIDSLTWELESLRFLLPEGYSGLIVDAGGYIGTSAIALHRMYPKAKVVVIEPSSANLKILKRNVGSIKNISLIHGALVGTAGDDVDVFDPQEKEWGYTTSTSHVGATPNSKLEAVPPITLRELFETHGEIGILKLDIEGGEADVLKEVGDSQIVFAVFVELHDRFVEGCSEAFWSFSAKRAVVKNDGEKFLSIRLD
jgi:FkbM family methyltransferase